MQAPSEQDLSRVAAPVAGLGCVRLVFEVMLHIGFEDERYVALSALYRSLRVC